MSSTTSSKLRSFLVTSIPPNLYDSVNPMVVAWWMGLGFSSYGFHPMMLYKAQQVSPEGLVLVFFFLQNQRLDFGFGL